MKHSILPLALLALVACSSQLDSSPDAHVEAPAGPSAAAASSTAEETLTEPAAIVANSIDSNSLASKRMDSKPMASKPMDSMADAMPHSMPALGIDAPAAMTSSKASAPAPNSMTKESMPTTEIATLAAGCFWCVEAVLEQVDGVQSVTSGYAGGDTLNPTYKQICTGTTGHAEVVQVTFDPRVLSYKDLLDWFWKSHDPTTLNRQGADRGTQYRSAIYVHSAAQRQIAETSKKDVQPTFKDPIVTEITDATTFYEAEKDHQGYYVDNSNQGYCRAVIAPKLKKLGLKY